jgi:hypothetical protein
MSLLLIIGAIFGICLVALLFILAVARMRGDPEEDNNRSGRNEENRRS